MCSVRLCRVSRRPLITCWSLETFKASANDKGGICPEFIGRLHPCCSEHRTAMDVMETGNEYASEEKAVCPKRSDELTSTQKLYLEKWMAEEALELEIVAR